MQEKGIYGIEDDCDQNMTQNTSASCQPQANSQVSSSEHFKLQNSSDDDNAPQMSAKSDSAEYV